MKKIIFLSVVAILVLFTLQVNALDSSRQVRLDFGYVLNVNNATTMPVTLVSGSNGVVKIVIQNNANIPIYDIRVDLALPPQILFLDDVSKRKISKLNPGEIKEIDYSIVTLPGSTEGVYSASFSMTYLNELGTERDEVDSFGIVIRSTPKIFASIDSTDIYEGNYYGDTTINFVNNNVGNVRFLTVELASSPDYDIISSNKKYIGDLDSNDFQSADFKLRVLKKTGEVVLPVKVTYKDTFNQDYSDSFNLSLKLRKPEEIGIKQNYTLYIIVGIVIIGIIIYLIVRRFGKRNKDR